MIGIAVGATVITLLVISMLNLGAKQDEIFDEYPVPTAETLTNYTRMQAAELQRKVCGDRASVFDVTSLDDTDPNLFEWLPQKITFVYLKPTETLFRQGCSIDDNGIQYEHFIIRNNMPIAVPNPRALFQSLTPVEAALEYLAAFSIVQTSNDTLSVITSERDFELMTAGCEIERIPPSKNIIVTNELGYYAVQLNVYDAITGGIYHQNWKVPIDPSHDANVMNAFKIGQYN